jgi:hypothetical protein
MPHADINSNDNNMAVRIPPLERDGLIQAAKHLNTTYYAIRQS